MLFRSGQTQGVPHKTKTAEQVSSYDGEAPQWFKNGIEAANIVVNTENQNNVNNETSSNTYSEEDLNKAKE